MVAKQTPGLVRQEVHNELLMFHPGRSEATALNPSAAQVFDLCDGAHSVEQIRAALDAAGLGPASEDAVWLALTELSAAGLIELDGPPKSHMTRREILRTLGVGVAAAALILPVVETIAAPPAAAQGSGAVVPTPVPIVPTPAPIGATPAPVKVPAPTFSPVTPPTFSPVTPPTFSPVTPPTFSPVTPPTFSPVTPPTFSPVTPPTFSPVTPPTFSPVTPPTFSPVTPPTFSPVTQITFAPVPAPTVSPALVRPTRAPIAAPTVAPVPAPTPAPIVGGG